MAEGLVPDESPGEAQSAAGNSELITPAAPTNSLAIIAFVLSLFGFVSGIGFIAGIVCGHISLSQIKRSRESGRGLAIAALVIGYVMVGLLLLLVALGMILIAFVMLNQGPGGPYGGHMPTRWNS